jgi:hypothetical protein
VSHQRQRLGARGARAGQPRRPGRARRRRRRGGAPQRAVRAAGGARGAGSPVLPAPSPAAPAAPPGPKERAPAARGRRAAHPRRRPRRRRGAGGPGLCRLGLARSPRVHILLRVHPRPGPPVRPAAPGGRLGRVRRGIRRARAARRGPPAARLRAGGAADFAPAVPVSRQKTARVRRGPRQRGARRPGGLFGAARGEGGGVPGVVPPSGAAARRGRAPAAGPRADGARGARVPRRPQGVHRRRGRRY